MTTLSVFCFNWGINCFLRLCWFLPSNNMHPSPINLLSPESPSTPLGYRRAPAPLCYGAASHELSVLHRVVHILMGQWYSLNSSHPLLPPLFPQVCPLCLHLHRYPENRCHHFSKLKFFFKMIFICLLLLLWMIFFCSCIPGDEIKFIFKGRARKIKHKILCVYWPPPTLLPYAWGLGRYNQTF